MHISVISPSIRPDGLKVTFETLRRQTLPPDIEWEWLPRLSIPRGKPDLAYQMNQAIKEAKGELIVVLQDWIKVGPTGLARFWEAYNENKNICFTAPVGKIKDRALFDSFEVSHETPNNKDIHWDWRTHWEKGRSMDSDRWEIDWGCGSKELIINAGLFDESFDDGFGWENVDLAYRMGKQGVRFECLPDNLSVAFDHDAAEDHPFKPKPNQDKWIIKKSMIDNLYADKGSEN